MNFSVLMSLYARENPCSLYECLESISRQSVLANEIVLVLDGPIGPELRDVVEQWNERLPIKIIPLVENVGLGRALNEGINHCTCEWIFRMDTDDICVENRFELQVRYIRKNPGVSIFGGQIEEFENKPGDLGVRRDVPIDQEDLCEYMKFRNPFNHMTVAYKKEAVEAVGGYMHHMWMEDYNLWIRLWAAGVKFGNMPQTLVLARAGMTMLSRRRGFPYLKSEWKLAKLKLSTGLQGRFAAFLGFVVRSLPRVMPINLLGSVYRLARSRVD